MDKRKMITPNPRYHAVTRNNISRFHQWRWIDSELQRAIDVVSRVLPFRSNSYVMDELIDWDQVPNDPMFQLTFPQRGMLEPDHFDEVADLIDNNAGLNQLKQTIQRIRHELNPHPAGQTTHNVPTLAGQPLNGIQHKYDQTVLFFPVQGQTCHAYCTFCFRWAQFTGQAKYKFQAKEVEQLIAYLKRHTEVTDVIITGGDPMVMKTKILRRYIEPLLRPDLDHLRTIRIGTKSVSYWPQRFVSDSDADDCLRLFEQVVESGRHLAFMSHINHPVEISTPTAHTALRRIRSTGASIYMQSPIVKHVNDHPDTWAELWRTGVQFGCVPYYMFVIRDTGARCYFEIPLVRAWSIFQKAYQQVSGLARTVRGPSMSAFPGKVQIVGIAKHRGRKVFVLDFLQARRGQMVRTPFFAQYDPSATWFDQLKPAAEADRRFFMDADVGDNVDRPREPVDVGSCLIPITIKRQGRLPFLESLIQRG